jgi:hypothetical protein
MRLGIALSTLYEWKNRYPDFREAINNGKAEVDYAVEDSLLKRALGYTVEEVTEEPQPYAVNGILQRDEDGNPVMRLEVSKRVKKYVAPDVAAAIFWLKNRKPAEWRDKQEIKHTGGPVQIVNDLPPDDE